MRAAIEQRLPALPAPPLIDLHLHLEGSLPPHTLAALAHRHRLPVPDLSAFEGFAGFLRAFGSVCDLMRDAGDFERAARDVIRRCARSGVVHVEILFSPQIFLRRGIPLTAIVTGLMRGREEAARRGTSAVFVLDGVRQWGGEWFESLIRQVLPWAGRGLAGVGIGGDERAIPGRDFARAFRVARAGGLRTTVHAGEAAGPGAVREAIRWLHPDRIGHGVAAARDLRVCAELRRKGIALEVCPTSNRATGVIPRGTPHPIRALFDAGVSVTIGSDDGAFFACDVRSEVEALLGSGQFAAGEMLRLQRHAASAAFLASRDRRALDRRLRQGWRRTLQIAAAAERRAPERA